MATCSEEERIYLDSLFQKNAPRTDLLPRIVDQRVPEVLRKKLFKAAIARERANQKFEALEQELIDLGFDKLWRDSILLQIETHAKSELQERDSSSES